MNATAVRPTLAARLRAVSKQQLALVALLPVLVVVWIPLVGGRSGSTPPPPAPAPAADVAPAATAAVPPAPAPAGETATGTGDTAALIARVRALTAPYTPRWTPAAGGPFRSSPAQAPVPIAVATASEPTLAPTAIVLSGGAPPIAIVQGRTCGIGDTVGGRTIVAIEERRVVYRSGDATFAVAMPVPTIGGRE